MKKIFIDGAAGTTGLKIEKRLTQRKDIKLLTLPDELRKNKTARTEMLNDADIVFLCLPDDAAKEAVAMIKNPDVYIIDTSTAHRTDSEWAYGFAELGKEFEEKIKNNRKIAVPGCHASGFIALIYPLIKSGMLPKNALLTCFSITGYSGGGKKMISMYEDEKRNSLFCAPRQYGLSQNHKHLPEMMSVTGLETAPLFSPVVSDFYSGMEVTVPLFESALNFGGADEIKEIYKKLYSSPIVLYSEGADEDGFLSAASLQGKDSMQISVYGNSERILLTARYDNLGKGASGAAIECLNIILGEEKTKTLVL